MATPSVPGQHEYQAIFNVSLDAIMLTSPNGDILAANPAACALLAEPRPSCARSVASGWSIPWTRGSRPRWKPGIQPGGSRES